MKKKILLIGDIILDEYINGNYTRIASETGVPLFSIINTKFMIGGAGNVAANISAADIDISLVSVLGNDKYSKQCIELLKHHSVDLSMSVEASNWKVSKKTRYMVNEKQVFRCDSEGRNTLSPEIETLIIKNVLNRIKEFELLVIVDYCQGLLTTHLSQEVINIAKGYHKKIIIDTKAPYLCHFSESYLIKTNSAELGTVLGMTCSTLDGITLAARKVIKTCNCKYVLTTWGEKGMVLTSNSSVEHISSNEESPVISVVGAGDTVTAYYSIGMLNNLTPKQCLLLSEKAARIAITLPKTTAVPFSAAENYLQILKQANKSEI